MVLGTGGVAGEKRKEQRVQSLRSQSQQRSTLFFLNFLSALLILLFLFFNHFKRCYDIQMKAIIERTIYYDLVVFLFVALPYLVFDHRTLLEL